MIKVPENQGGMDIGRKKWSLEIKGRDNILFLERWKISFVVGEHKGFYMY